MPALPADNLKYPVLVKTDNGTGSGFYHQAEKNLFLITAYHVLYDKDGKLHSHKMELISYGKSNDDQIHVYVDLSSASIRKDSTKDIALIAILEIKSSPKKTLPLSPGVSIKESINDQIVVVPTNGMKKYRDIKISNEVFILGYPLSIGHPQHPQIQLDRPLLRKGVVAGKNLEKGTIILDCPVYYGNSGGIVIEVDINGLQYSYRTIGIAVEFVPFVDELISTHYNYKNTNIENSGYSIAVPMDKVIELAEE